MKKIVMFLLMMVCLVTVTGCSNTNSNLEEITFKELATLMDNKESFVIEVFQDGCSHCAVFTPRFKSVLNEYGVYAKSINLSSLSQEEYNQLSEYFKVSGTPTVVFIKDGQERTTINRIIGEAKKTEIIRKLKQNGYIK